MSGAWWRLTRNPVVGCSTATPEMPDCLKCWAKRFAMRQITREGPTGDAYRDVVKDGEWTGVTRFVESALKRVPGRGKVVFVSDMGDLWHDTTQTHWIAQVLEWARKHPQHTFVNCTKRPKRAAEWPGHIGPLPDNWVQLVSVGNQKTARERLPHAVSCQAKIRGAHIEPLLGPIDLSPWLPGDNLITTSDGRQFDPSKIDSVLSHLKGCPVPVTGGRGIKQVLNWIVVGGETGPGARPCDPAWVQSIVDQCQATGVPVWVKQAPEPRKSQTEGYSDIIEGKTFSWPREKPEGMP